MTEQLKEIRISKEDAVFWLDGNGRWHNEHGPFENRKIISFFHAHICRDAQGYHVAQQREGLIEKVYFKYEDTALFVFDIHTGTQPELVLNTGKTVPLLPERLIISDDSLYMIDGDERMKFVDRALLKISKMIEFNEQDTYNICIGDQAYRIREDNADGSN